MPQIAMKELLEAGVHFGHQTQKWNPKMKPYVFGARNGIYIIDLQKTVELTKTACDFLQKLTSEGKKVLFVGTKKQSSEIVQEEATRAGQYFVTNRWLGGMLTNFSTVRASIDRLKKIEGLMGSDDWAEFNKKEKARFEREHKKLKDSLGGIEDMKKLPAAIFIIDTMKEHIAVKEAVKLGIPTVAVVDTNCDPAGITYVVPGNDDAIRSVRLFCRIIADACLEGTKTFQERLRGQEGAVAPVVRDEKEELLVEKKVSRFEGDIDLKGIDEADLETLEATPEEVVTEKPVV
jgi:small subunit ribosomal protein S2